MPVEGEGVVVGGGLVALITGGIAFVRGWRLTRGTVNTTTAENLWEAQHRALILAREDYNLVRAEVASLRTDLHQRDELIERLEIEKRQQSRQISHLQAEVGRLIELLPSDVRTRYNTMHFYEEEAGA